MNYQEYIKLGFKRTDLDDNVEFRQTGYYGFAIEKQLAKGIAICASSGELHKPKLYINKKGQITCHIIPITVECVIDLCANFSKTNKK